MEIKMDVAELAKHKLFVATPMYGGQCILGSALIPTEDGIRTIKNIVDTKYSGKVKSFNKTSGTFEWNNVTNWFVNKNMNPKKEWVRVKTNSNRKELVCTKDHECLVFNNPLKPELDFEKAENITGKYIVRNPQKFEYPLFNSEQLSVLIGTSLGDASIKKSGNVVITHAKKQKEYIEYIHRILGGKLKLEKQNNFSKDDEKYSLNLPSNAQSKYLRDLMYVNNKKTVKNISEYITEQSLAFWYFDDGYLIKERYRDGYVSSPYAVLCTDGFSEDDCKILCNVLQERWGIEASVIKYKTYNRIAISVEGSKNFWRIISPYRCNSMEYKFPRGFNHSVKRTINEKHLEFSAFLVKSLRLYKKNGKRYDITVDNTHNFVADNSVVHNCFGTFAVGMINLAALCTHYKLPFQPYFLFNESLIPRARNYCCDEFLRSESTHMMFIDGDIGFDAKDVIALMILQIQNPDYDIIGAVYPKKTIAWEKVKAAVDKGLADENPEVLGNYVGDYVVNFKAGTSAIKLTEPAEVLEIGTGFMMIRRETLLKFKEKFPYLYKPDHVRTAQFDGTREIMQFFQAEIDPVSKRYLSEDYWFCQKVQEIGLKTWICPWMKLTHTGTMVYGGSLADLASAGVSATADTKLLKKQK